MASLDTIRADFVTAKTEVKASIEQIRGVLDGSPQPPDAIIPTYTLELQRKINELTKLDTKIAALDAHVSNPG